MKRNAVTVGIFVLASLIGPLLALLTTMASVQSSGVQTFIFLLWPPSPLGTIGYTQGALVAGVLTIGGNLIFYGLTGLAIAITARSIGSLVSLYLFLAVVICALASWAGGFWQPGFDIREWNPLPLIAALAAYAFLFWIAARRYHHLWK